VSRFQSKAPCSPSRNKRAMEYEHCLMKSILHASLKSLRMTIMNDLSLIPLWLIIGGIVGALIGNSRNNVVGGAFWGALLGPVGWVIAFFLDERRRCSKCQTPIEDGATRCPGCGVELFAQRKKPALKGTENIGPDSSMGPAKGN
jgi:hypothetical protein